MQELWARCVHQRTWISLQWASVAWRSQTAAACSRGRCASCLLSWRRGDGAVLCLSGLKVLVDEGYEEGVSTDAVSTASVLTPHGQRSVSQEGRQTLSANLCLGQQELRQDGGNNDAHRRNGQRCI